MCYDHAQSRMCVMSAIQYRRAGMHKLAQAYWIIAKHHAEYARKSYEHNLSLPA